MSKQLKGVIFTINNVLTSKNGRSPVFLEEVKRLVEQLRLKNLQVAVLANHPNDELEEELNGGTDDFPWFIVFRDKFASAKQSPKAIEYVLSKLGLEPTEALYIGNAKDDMRAACNGSLLFLNAVWFARNTNYGIEFTEPWEIARFIDIFCLRDSLWGYSIVDNDFEYYALAPFSTYNPAYSSYSANARSSAKDGEGNIDFWTKYLWSTIYFSELYKKIQIIAPIPGHKANQISTASNIIEQPLLAFTKCFKIQYLKDLVIRHRDSVKSQRARKEGLVVDHKNQLNTIKLNSNPIKGDGQIYKNNPLDSDKTILLVDDFCTEGYSLDAARVYIKKTGAKVICLSWLKTINRNYKKILSLQPSDLNPYQPNNFSNVEYMEYDYITYQINANASSQLEIRLKAYENWFQEHWADRP